MAELDSPRPTGKIWRVLLTILVLVAIGGAILVAMRPDLFSFRAAPLVQRVSIVPPEAQVGGGQWRLVSQWQGAGDVHQADNIYLVEFKSVPGWETPAPVVLKRGEVNARVEGAYKPAQYSEQTILTLTGATTLASRLVPELAQLYLKHIGANEVRRVPGKTADDITVQGIFYSTRELRNIQIQGRGTPAGFQALRDRTCDVAMAAQRPTVDEFRPGFVEYKLGMDAVAVIVHRDNPVPALTVEEIGRIFAGEITNWEQVGGPAAPIKLFALRDTLGTRRFFDGFFLNGRLLSSAAREVDVHVSMPELVSQDPWAIGFCSITLASDCREMAIRSEIDGRTVLPTPQAVRSGDYPATRDMLFYLRSNSENVYALDFVRISQGDLGQAIVRKFGFVGLHEKAEQGESTQVRMPVSMQTTPSGSLPADEPGPADENVLAAANASMTGGPLSTDPALPEGAARSPEGVSHVAVNSTADAAGATLAMDAPSSAELRPQASRAVVSDPLPPLVQFDDEAVADDTRRRVLQNYLGGLQGARQLPFVFRFKSGTLELDEPSAQNVARVVARMKEPIHAGRTIVLVGFSDSAGAYASNLAVSRRRAESVAQALKTRGLGNVVLLAAGEEGAVERNDSRAGREANRRVEVWLK